MWGFFLGLCAEQIFVQMPEEAQHKLDGKQGGLYTQRREWGKFGHVVYQNADFMAVWFDGVRWRIAGGSPDRFKG